MNINLISIDRAGNTGSISIPLYIDLEPPVIINTIPNGTVSVRPDMIQVQFNEEMDLTTISVSGIGDSGSFQVDGNILEFFPESPFEFGHTYIFTIRGKDTSGNAMEIADIEIRVTDQVMLTGWVLDENGKGLGEALITLDNGKFTYTEKDGSYSIETKMGNITIYASKSGFNTRSTSITARPDRDNSVRALKLDRDDADLVSRVSSFFQDPLNLLLSGLVMMFLMFISFMFFRTWDREKITDVEIEMDEDDQSDESLD